MKESNKVVYKCDYCGTEYHNKEECGDCEKNCLKIKEQKARLDEIAKAMTTLDELTKKYEEDYGAGTVKEILAYLDEDEYDDMFGIVVNNGEVKCTHNGKEVDLKEMIRYISLDPLNVLKLLV